MLKQISKISIKVFTLVCFIVLCFALTGFFGDFAMKVAGVVVILPLVVFIVLYIMYYDKIKKEVKKRLKEDRLQ